MKALWLRREGSTALTLIWFMLFAVMMAIGVDSFLGVYIARQQGRSAADAAALAVTRAISVALPEEVRLEAGRRVAAIVRDPIVSERMAAYGDELRAEQQACAAAPPCVPLTARESEELLRDLLISEYQDSFGRQYRGSLRRSMAERIADGTWSGAEAADLRDQLIPDNTDLGCLTMAAAVKHRSDVLAEAELFAQANRASLDWSRSELGLARGRHRIVVLRTVHPFGAEWIMEDGTLPKLHIEDLAVLSQVGSRTPTYPEHC